MLRWIRRIRTFGDKVTLLLTLTSALAIVLVSGVLGVFDYVDARQQAVAAIESRAGIVAMNSAAPLAFDDRTTAREALLNFSSAGNVGSATVFDATGRRFADYRRAERPPPVVAAGTTDETDDGEWHVLTWPIADRGQYLGQLQVVYELDMVHARLLRTVLLSLAVVGIALTMSYASARWLKDVLAKPVAELARTASQVSATKNYALRADKFSDDELGTFTEVFNDMLDQIQRRDAQIQAAHFDAERASRIKDEFLATLSHELRTPMTPILGWAQVLLRIAKNDQAILQAATAIERNARAQTQIVDDLLDMSSIISGKLRLDMQNVDLVEVIESALATVEPIARSKDIALVRTLDPHVGAVHGDPGRLRQVVWNLLTNAIKFTQRGGCVEISLACSDAQAEIAVRDDGRGIAPEFLPHVFERFRQADSSTTREHGGLGLGLAIARQLIELQGGSVRAASAGVDRGATFTVYLPLAPAQAPAAVPAAALPSAPLPARALRGICIVLVDDEADARALLRHILDEAGAETHAVATAADALATIERLHPDVLISDIGMPDVDGYELVRQLRRLPAEAGGNVPAIALTAFARSEDRSRALLAGYQTHLLKPVDAQALVAAVAGLCGERRVEEGQG